MADRIRHVNTASTAGGTGLSNATTGVDRAYATMSECEAAEQDDFALAGDRLIIYAEGLESGTITEFTFDGSITSATSDIVVIGNLAYTAESSQSYGPTARISDQYVSLVGTIVKNTSDSNGRCIDLNVGYDGSKIIGCILDKTTTTATPGAFTPALYIEQPIGDVSIVNNVIFGHMSAGISTFSTADSVGTVQVYNNTIISNTGAYGVDMVAQPSQSVRLFNNIVQMQGGGTAYRASTWAATGANISSDATSPDGVSFQNIALTFVDAANDDYHLAAVDTPAIDGGVYLGADAQYPFADDFDGTVRPQSTGWDIGAFEYTSAADIFIVPDSAFARLLTATGPVVLGSLFTPLAPSVSRVESQSPGLTMGSINRVLLPSESVCLVMEPVTVMGSVSIVLAPSSVRSETVDPMVAIFNKIEPTHVGIRMRLFEATGQKIKLTEKAGG